MTDLVAYADVIRRQRMTRPPYADEAVARDLVADIVAEAQKAPSAGFAQGATFLALDDPADVREFYRLALPDSVDIDIGLLLPTPVILLPMQSRTPYLERYSRDDKQQWGLDVADAWPVPYWTVDTAFAAMIVLLSATARGLGCWFFGIFGNEAELMQRFGVPDDTRPIGAIALGWPDDAGKPRRSKPGRRDLTDVLRWGSW